MKTQIIQNNKQPPFQGRTKIISGYEERYFGNLCEKLRKSKALKNAGGRIEFCNHAVYLCPENKTLLGKIFGTPVKISSLGPNYFQKAPETIKRVISIYSNSFLGKTLGTKVNTSMYRLGFEDLNNINEETVTKAFLELKNIKRIK